MAIKCNGSICKKINFNNFDVKFLKKDGVLMWVKPFNLSYSLGEGVSSISVSRISSYDPSAKIGVLNGDMVFYKDNLSVSAVASSDYELDNYQSNYIIESDTLIQINASRVYYYVIVQAMYNNTILASQNVRVKKGSRLSSSVCYGGTYTLGDVIYENPFYESIIVGDSPTTITTVYQTKSTTNTIAPQISYSLVDESESSQTYYFELQIYDRGRVGGNVYVYESNSSNITESIIVSSGKRIGTVAANNDYTISYSTTTSYSSPSKYIHIAIYRNGTWTNIATIQVSA